MSLDLPALFHDADSASNAQQNRYLSLIVAEYGAILVAAILTTINAKHAGFLVIYALIIIASLSIMLVRTLSKPEQDWYKCRALAESIKTIAWRYSMKSEPFNDRLQIESKKDFRDYLTEILKANAHIGHTIAGLNTGGAQVTDSMNQIRGGSISDRKQFYLKHRIDDQKKWYATKSRFNKNRMKLCVCLSSLVYAISVIAVIMQIPYPGSFSVVEPLMVLAASFVGWMQIRKFNELSSAYALTAHEISLVRDKIFEAKTDAELSSFVNEAELVFSREHTQWVARQNQV